MLVKQAVLQSLALPSHYEVTHLGLFLVSCLPPCHHAAPDATVLLGQTGSDTVLPGHRPLLTVEQRRTVEEEEDEGGQG